MPSRKIRLGAPYRWLVSAFAMLRAHPRPLFRAAILLVGVAILPSLLELLIETALNPSALLRELIQAFFVIVGLLLVPPVSGAVYRMLARLSDNPQTTTLSLSDIYRDGPLAMRLILTNLVFLMITLAVVFGLIAALGGQPLLDYLRAVQAMQQAGALATAPAPTGLAPLLVSLVLAMLLIGTAQQLACAQVALNGRPILAAVVDGLSASLRNVGALLLFYLPIGLLALTALLVLALIAAVFFAALSALSPTLAALLLVPMALLLLTCLYMLLFAFYYQAWLELFGPEGQPASALHQLEA